MPSNALPPNPTLKKPVEPFAAALGDVGAGVRESTARLHPIAVYPAYCGTELGVIAFRLELGLAVFALAGWVVLWPRLSSQTVMPVPRVQSLALVAAEW